MAEAAAPDVLHIQSVVFQRKQGMAWEEGLMINEDELIIDMEGKPVKAPINNYARRYNLVVYYVGSGTADKQKVAKK